MEIRAMTAADLSGALEIDATVESAEYLHLHREGEGLGGSWKLEQRPLREKRVHRNALTDEQTFAIKQIALGVEDGIARVAEHEAQIVAAAAAQADEAAGLLRIIDLRFDFDFRRQGLASAMIFQIIQEARDRRLRAVMAEISSDNFPALQFFAKLNFEPAGFDTHAKSNHDLVKDSVLLFWYLPLK
jgi:ribosomal protein S18 acetylase RimI-like enzyme